MSTSPGDDPRMTAAIDLLRRTGQRTFQLRYSDDEQPVIWIAVGEWSIGDDGRPVRAGGREHFETAAALHPVTAVLRLLELMVDGGQCAHCKRPTGVLPELEPPSRSQLLEAAICWYVFDARGERFVSGCRWEGNSGR